MQELGSNHGYTLFGLDRISEKDNFIGPLGDRIIVPAIYRDRILLYALSIQGRTCVEISPPDRDEFPDPSRLEICVMGYFKPTLDSVYRAVASSITPWKNRQGRKGNMLSRATLCNITQPIHGGIAMLVAARLGANLDHVYENLSLFDREGYHLQENKNISDTIHESVRDETLLVSWKEELIN